MESSKILAIISIIIGLIFIIFPIFSANLISILIGAAVFIFGLGLAYTGIISKDISPAVSTVSAYCWIHAYHNFHNRIAWRS